jgi:hypothetical protein
MMRAFLLAWTAGLATGFGCALVGAFACEGDGECDDAGVQGTCEASGWCSFPDGDCESGQRYGAHSGDGLGGECVTPPGGSSSESTGDGEADGTSTSTGTSTSDDGTSADGDTSGVSAETTASSSESSDDTGTESGDESGSAGF